MAMRFCVSVIVMMKNAAGLSLEDVQRILLMSEEDTNGFVLRKRLQDIGEEIQTLQSQQRLIAKMLKVQAQG